MLRFMRQIRNSILEDQFEDFVVKFLRENYQNQNQQIPNWVQEALIYSNLLTSNHEIFMSSLSSVGEEKEEKDKNGDDSEKDEMKEREEKSNK